MSPERVIVLRQTVGQSARAAVLLGLLFSLLIYGLVRLITKTGTPLGTVVAGGGFPVPLVYALALGAVWAIALVGFFQAATRAPRLEVRPDGLRVVGQLGSYRLSWPNIREAAVTRSGALGLRLARREEMLETHEGTPQQREWLRTMEPFGEWDLVFNRAELGRPASEASELLQPYLARSG
jgi:hypothetical protein